MNTFTRTGVGIAAALLLVIPLISVAAELRTGDELALSSSERITDDLYIAGGNVTTAAVVTGDLVAAGGNVLINGSTSGDVLAGAGTLTILGSVGDDARISGGTIIVSGAVGDDLLIGAGQTTISGSGIGGDIVWGGGSIRIDAPVAGDLVLGGGEVFINSTIGGNVRFSGESLTLGSGAVIEGDLTYKSGKEAKIQEGAVVRGETVFEQTKDMRGVSKNGLLALLTLATLGKFLSILACAMLLGLVFKRYALALVETAAAKPLSEIGRGVTILILMPIVSIMLLITLLGIPLGIIGLAAYVGALVFASILAPIILGSLAYSWFTKRGYEVSWQTILLGSALYLVLGLIPVVGWAAVFAFVLLALGAAIKMKVTIAQNWK